MNAEQLAVIDQLMIALRAQNDTMNLTEAETNRARQIKRAVEVGSEELVEAETPVTPLTDFEYVQFALFCETDEPMSAILYRISMLQAFKREYHIEDTLEQGMGMLDRGTQLLPGFFLAVSHLPSSQNYVSVEDWSKFYPSVLQNEEAFRTFIGLLYYKSKAKEPHIESTRSGTTSVIECQGMNSQEHCDMAMLERIVHSFWRWYPGKHKEAFFMNSPSLISVWCGIFKKFLPYGSCRTIKIGMQVPGLEGERIDPFYKNPSEEQARQAMLQKARELLLLRYHNERTFVLPPESDASQQNQH